jgi:hypothetical protein
LPYLLAFQFIISKGRVQMPAEGILAAAEGNAIHEYFEEWWYVYGIK